MQPLLAALHARVAAADAPSGLAGTIAVGVREGGGVVWWSARFALHATAAFAPADDADGWIVLGQRAADAVVRGAAPRPSDVDVGGDTALVDRFLARYGAPVRPWETR